MRWISLSVIFIFAFSLFSSAIGFFAEAHENSEANVLFFCEDFNSTSKADSLRSMSFSPTNNKIILENRAASDKCVHILMEGGDNSGDVSIKRAFNGERPSGKFVFEAEIMAEKIGGCSLRLGMRCPESESAGGGIYPLVISSSGKVSEIGGGEIISHVSEGAFYKFQLCFNFNTKSYDTYVDGVKVLSGVSFGTTPYPFDDLSQFFFMTKDVESFCETEYYIDNIKLYQGSEPLTPNGFNSANWVLSNDKSAVPSSQMIGCSTKNAVAFYPGAKKAFVQGSLNDVDSACIITGNIKDAEKYYGVNPHFKEVFEFLKTIDEKPLGNFEFENFNGGKSESQTRDLDKDGNERVLEAHRDYLDIHYVIKGAEGFGYARCDILEAVTGYNKEQDYILLQGEKNKIILHEGDFCIVFPEDAHTPCMSGGDDSKLQKAVIKIKVS